MGALVLDTTIMGAPRGKARHRTRIVRPADPRKKPWPQEYYDPKDKAVIWEREAADLFGSLWAGKAPLRVPLRVIVDAVARRPDDVPESLGIGRLWRMADPDGDNVMKAVCDALQKAGVVINDNCCCRKVVESYFAAEGEAAHTRVLVHVLDPLPIVPRPVVPGTQQALQL